MLVVNDVSPFILTEENFRWRKSKLLQKCQPVSQVKMYMCTSADRRYNLPHHEKVAVVFVVQDGVPPVPKDVVIYPRDRPLQTITVLNSKKFYQQYVVDAYWRLEGNNFD